MKEKETKNVAAFRDANLKTGETIQFFLEGWIGEMMGKGDKKQHNGSFILTDKRACFYRKGMFGEVLETIPLAQISSVETLSMMGYRVLRLHTSHDALAFKTFEDKLLFDKVYSRLEELRNERTPASDLTGQTQDSGLNQLRKLAELRDAGILTDEEFSTKKADILGRI